MRSEQEQNKARQTGTPTPAKHLAASRCARGRRSHAAGTPRVLRGVPRPPALAGRGQGGGLLRHPGRIGPPGSRVDAKLTRLS